MDCDLRSAELLFDVEEAGFKDDLEQCAVVMGHGGYGVDGVLDSVIVAALELADGHDHVEFANAEAGQSGGLLAERGDQGGPKRESDGESDGSSGSGKDVDRGGCPDGVDHGTGEAVADRLVAEVFNLVARCLGF